jgi:hypothetical protein
VKCLDFASGNGRSEIDKLVWLVKNIRGDLAKEIGDLVAGERIGLCSVFEDGGDFGHEGANVLVVFVAVKGVGVGNSVSVVLVVVFVRTLPYITSSVLLALRCRYKTAVSPPPSLPIRPAAAETLVVCASTPTKFTAVITSLSVPHPSVWRSTRGR